MFTLINVKQQLNLKYSYKLHACAGAVLKINFLERDLRKHEYEYKMLILEDGPSMCRFNMLQSTKDNGNNYCYFFKIIFSFISFLYFVVKDCKEEKLSRVPYVLSCVTISWEPSWSQDVTKT